MTNKKRIVFLKYFAGCMTAIVALLVFTAIMFRFTDKDLLEILTVYGLFVYAPSFFLPFIIAGEDPEDDYGYEDEYDDY